MSKGDARLAIARMPREPNSSDWLSLLTLAIRLMFEAYAEEDSDIDRCRRAAFFAVKDMRRADTL